MVPFGSLEKNEVVFPKLGISLHVDETAFTVFGLEIKWYGLLITAGILLAMIYGFTRMKRYGIDPDRAVDAVIAGIIGAVIGARAYYVIMEWDSYSGNWKEILNIRNGGLAVYGGIIGALLIGGSVAKIRKLRLLPLLDIAGIGLLLGQGIGRWGNFTNQEAFGYNTESIFGMTSEAVQSWIVSEQGGIDPSEAVMAMNPETPVHPCFLYESVWCILGFILFALLEKKIRKFDGQMFLMYLIWYGAERAVVEGLRTDSLMLGTIRVSQALSVILVIVSAVLLVVMYGKVKRMGEDYVLYADTEESKEMIRRYEERSKSKKTNEDNENTENDGDVSDVTESNKDNEITESEEK
ncbi:MAG: prolipoprotein diacylglyceryl transferase [Clostridium sp.]|nr:prolipoprotein diacylglyceryl transferase [Clostridium sp.]MCM1547326.1 prolipoprotein diacylglyceryl transferase [Ruminococcus sp.]